MNKKIRFEDLFKVENRCMRMHEQLQLIVFEDRMTLSRMVDAQRIILYTFETHTSLPQIRHNFLSAN